MTKEVVYDFAIIGGGIVGAATLYKMQMALPGLNIILIEKEKISGVVLLSADRHRHDLWKIERPQGYPFYEFESSKITNVHTHPRLKSAVYSYNKRGFGWMQFDTTREDATLTYRIIGEANDTVYEFVLNRSHIEF